MSSEGSSTKESSPVVEETSSKSESTHEKITFNPEWLRRCEGYCEWETPYPDHWRTYIDYKPVLTVPQAYYEYAETTPDKPCFGERKKIIAEDGTKSFSDYQFLSWSECGLISRWIAAGLDVLNKQENLGLLPREGHVGIFSVNVADWVLCEFAAYARLFAVVPVYPTCGAGTIDYIIRHAEIPIVFTNNASVGSLFEDLCLPYEQAEKEGKPAPENLPPLKCVVTIGDDHRSKSLSENPLPPLSEPAQKMADKLGTKIMSLYDLIQLAKQSLGADTDPSIQPPAPELPDPEDDCTIVYTSGSEGTPKGVVHSHKSYLNTANAITRGPEFGGKIGESIYYSYLPLAHVLERHAIGTFVRSGGTVGFTSGLSNMIDDLSLLRPHLMVGVPRVWKRIYDKVTATVDKLPFYKRWAFNWAISSKIAARKSGSSTWVDWDYYVLSDVQKKLGGRLICVVSGGAAVDPALAEWIMAAFNVPIVQGYGLTETFAAICVQHHDAMNDPGAVGPPVMGVTVRLEDIPDMDYYTESNRPRGEILIKAPQLMSRYYKAPEKTREVMTEDGFFHTGDIGELLEDGEVKIIDRKKNLFKLAQGEYIAIEYLESVYSQCPLVEQIWVYGDPLSNFLVAVVVPNKSHLLEAIKEARPETPQELLDDYAALCADKDIVSFVLKKMEEVANESHLLSYQKVKTIYLESNEWTIENNLLTPTFKLRRGLVKEKYKEIVVDLIRNYRAPPRKQ